jgi:hypothetical protein
MIFHTLVIENSIVVLLGKKNFHRSVHFMTKTIIPMLTNNTRQYKVVIGVVGEFDDGFGHLGSFFVMERAWKINKMFGMVCL